jgi:hypothetical protein
MRGEQLVHRGKIGVEHRIQFILLPGEAGGQEFLRLIGRGGRLASAALDARFERPKPDLTQARYAARLGYRGAL